MIGKIRAEWERLTKVVIHRPGIEMFFGLLDPHSSLYERAFSMDGARMEHRMLENILTQELGVEVIRLEKLVEEACKKRPEVRKRLIHLARETLNYIGPPKLVKQAQKEFDNNAQYLDTMHFFNILLMDPGLNFETDKRGVNSSVHLDFTGRNPLCNLYFMRDQQFVTDKGIVLCRMGKNTRAAEPKVTKFLWEEVLGVPIICEIKSPGTIEGGEFIPMGSFALVGIGSRTNREAINQLLSLDFDYKEIGVVHQPMHPLVSSKEPDPMINMHLDTYFNVASSSVVVGCELLLKNAKVEIFHNEGNGYFTKDKNEPTLYDYIIKKGFEVINVTSLEQLCYASNFLCVRDGVILAIETERNVRNVMNNLEMKARNNHKRYGKLLAQAKQDYALLKNEGQFFPHKKELYRNNVEVYPIVLKNLTGGYGGAHCMTCALERS
jgi:arginine deiminase